MTDPTQVFEEYEILLVSAVVAALGYVYLGNPLTAAGICFGYCAGIVHYAIESQSWKAARLSASESTEIKKAA